LITGEISSTRKRYGDGMDVDDGDEEYEYEYDDEDDEDMPEMKIVLVGEDALECTSLCFGLVANLTDIMN
jgi:hypothetical protein